MVKDNRPIVPGPRSQIEKDTLNALIRERGVEWVRHVRSIKFEIELEAIEEERRRIAKDLHDETLPSLARIIRFIQSDANASSCQELVEELHETVADFRLLLAELHPVDLEELGLVAALSNLSKRYSMITNRSIAFKEQSEECRLSCRQQLSVYRAVQVILRMFSDSENDYLVIEYDCSTDSSIISLRCLDRRVSSRHWLADSANLSTLESWCDMAGATLSLENDDPLKSVHDVVLEASENRSMHNEILGILGELTKVRLYELDSIITLARKEWSEAIRRDCSLFRNLAVEMERQKISEEINCLILPHFESIEKLVAAHDDTVFRQEARKRLVGITSGVKGVLSELHPRLLDEVGLLASIRTLVDRFRHATMVETTLIYNVWCNWTEAVPLETKYVIYRIIQEALNNIEKHSRATRALVVVTKDSNDLVVCIEDNGRGFRESISTKSRGLRIIRERAATIGASVTWRESATFSTGTLLLISLSWPSSASQLETSNRVNVNQARLG